MPVNTRSRTVEQLSPPWVVRSALSGTERYYGSSLLAFGSPRLDLQARLLTANNVRVLPAEAQVVFEQEAATFDAFGFENFALSQEEGGVGDLARYKARAGEGIYKYVSGSVFQHLTEIAYAPVSAVGYAYDALSGWSGYDDFARTPDDVTIYTDSLGGGGEACDPSSWGTATGPTPSFSGIGAGWVISSSVSATVSGAFSGGGIFVCADSEASLTLSDPCIWSDLAAFAVSEGAKLGVAGFALGVEVYSTDAGASDGTRHMRRRAARYRARVESFARTAHWKVVKRRLVPSFALGTTGVLFTPTLRRTENMELVARPYLDEFGAWSPTDLAWGEVAEKELRWRGDEAANLFLPAQSSSGSLVGTSGISEAPRVWASRVRALLPASAGVAVVRWEIARTLTGGSVVTTTMDSAVAGGTTDYLDFGPDAGASLTRVRIQQLLDADGHVVDTVQVPDAQRRVLYRQRKLWRTVGWPPFQVGADPIPPHTFYRRRQWTYQQALDATAPWTSFSTIWHAPCVCEMSETFHQDYDLVTGEMLPRVVTESVAEANGIEWPWNPVPVLGVDGDYQTVGTILSGTLAETVLALPQAAQLTFPVDRVRPDARQPAEEVTELSEAIAAGEAGIWRLLEAPRGYSLTVEDAGWSL